MNTLVLGQEPYADIICSKLRKDNQIHTTLTTLEKVEAISDIIIGDKNTRWGPQPSPEGLVHIRKVVRESINRKLPIPILIPWGSIKADFSAELDIAEVVALQHVAAMAYQIRELGHRVEAVIRVEDISGYSLMTYGQKDSLGIISNIDLYSEDMVKLTRILAPELGIEVVKESNMDGANIFNNNSMDINQSLLSNYLKESDTILRENVGKPIEDHIGYIKHLESYVELHNHGWKGIIPLEQRDHYLKAYDKIYPDWSENSKLDRLALYFAGAWRRFQLGMTGKRPYWYYGHIQLAFVPPIKGLPEGYNDNYVYHRTLPLCDARTHICPWRAKGYIKIGQGNQIQYKLSSFNDKELIESLNPLSIELTDNKGENKVTIRADYKVCS